MNASRMLGATFALVGLVAAVAYLLNSSSTESAQRDLQPVEQGLQPLTARAEEDSLAPLAPASLAGSEEQREVVETSLAGETRSLAVTVDLPPEAPSDAELAVLAVASAEAPEEADALVLQRLRATPDSIVARSLVEPDGSARLDVPEGLDVRLLLDGRFLFLEEPVSATAQDDSVGLRARLGACLVVRVDGSQGDLDGSLALAGGSFGGGRAGGWQRLEQTAERGATLEFRALDTRLTWSLMPSFAEHQAEPRLGLALEAGERRELQLEVSPGATLSGEVRDEAGAPLAGVEVRTAASAMSWMGGGSTRSAITDAEGRFTLLAVEPGDQQLEAELDGWRDYRGPTFTAADGEHVKGLRLVLDRGEAIRGVVRWPDGTPAADAVVSAESLQRSGFGNWGGVRVQRAGETRSAADGSFALGGLESGSYTVRASLDRSSDPEASAVWRAAEESVATATSGLLLQLEGPVSFRGRVLDDRGEPVQAFTLRVESTEQGGPRERQSYTAPEGSYVFARVGPGEWEVEVEAEGYTHPEPAKLVLSAEGTELDLSLERTVGLAGIVLDGDGAPLAGATVRADDGSSTSNPWMGPGGETTETDAEGHFHFDELSAGTLTVSASADAWADSAPQTFQLTPGSTYEDARLQLRVGGRIEGAVLTPEGDPISSQRVTWGSNAMGFGAQGETTTDSAGRFAFEHVTPGDWAVSAAPSMEEMGSRMRGRRDASAFTEIMGQLVTKTVTVVDGRLTEVFLGGEPRRPVRIFGAVTLAGEPVVGANVVAVSESSAVFEGMKSAPSAEDGSFELVVDRPGPHTISAQADNLGVAVSILVPSKDEVRVDLAIPLGRIEGIVRKPGGSPASGVRLTIQREDGLGRMRWGGDQAVSREDGSYALEALEAGRYTVRANAASWGGRANSDWGTAVRSGIEVGVDETRAGVDFRLETAGSVEGLVLRSDGVPLSGASLFFRDVEGRMVSSVSSTTTNAAGEFRYEGLAPGEYSVSVRAEAYASSEVTRLRVAADETTEVRVEVEAATTLVVSVEEEDGAAMRARFEVFDEDGKEVGTLMTVDALRSMFNQGGSALEQKIGPLPAGRYTVRATLSDGQTSEKRVLLRGRPGEKQVRLKLKS